MRFHRRWQLYSVRFSLSLILFICSFLFGWRGSGSNEATRSRTKGWFPVGLRGRAYKLTSLESLCGGTRGRFQFVSQSLKLPGRHNFFFFRAAIDTPLLWTVTGKIITVTRHCHLCTPKNMPLYLLSFSSSSISSRWTKLFRREGDRHDWFTYYSFSPFGRTLSPRQTDWRDWFCPVWLSPRTYSLWGFHVLWNWIPWRSDWNKVDSVGIFERGRIRCLKYCGFLVDALCAWRFLLT